MRERPDVVILGGSGPIGRAIVRAASDRSVLAVSRAGAVAVDARDSAAVKDLLTDARPSALVYLVNGADAPDAATSMLNGALAAAAHAGVQRMVYASSAAVYGDGARAPYTESSPLVGVSDYARTKIRAEEALGAAADIASVIALRIFNVFGAGCDGSLLNKLAFGPPPRLLETSGFVRDYVHVDDVADAFLAALDRPGVHGAVNIGSGIAVDNTQLARAAGTDRFDAAAGEDVWSFSVADVERARRELDWQARVDPIDALLRRTDRLD